MLFRQLGILCITALLTACATEPVQPWEKGNLASKVMQKNNDVQHTSFIEHAYSSKEATAGGHGVGAGGCGCN